MFKNLIVCLICTFATYVSAADLPYNETAVAKADITRALEQAKSDGTKVLIIFGANWCKDCRQLDKSMSGGSRDLIIKKFIVVKVDVGNFDKNLDLSMKYGNPTKKGIPAAVILSADGDLIYSTKAGELSDARKLGDGGIYAFFKNIISTREILSE
jgi:thioredoxin 1